MSCFPKCVISHNDISHSNFTGYRLDSWYSPGGDSTPAPNSLILSHIAIDISLSFLFPITLVSTNFHILSCSFFNESPGRFLGYKSGTHHLFSLVEIHRCIILGFSSTNLPKRKNPVFNDFLNCFCALETLS